MSANPAEVKYIDARAGSGRRDRRSWGELEAELATGLRNHWYALIPSDEVPAE